MRTFLGLCLLALVGDSLVVPPPSKNRIEPPRTTQKQTFDLNLGKCIDSLRQDIQSFPYYELDWDLYTPDVVFCDHSGKYTRGLSKYKNLFAGLRFFSKMVADNVMVTYTLRYDLEEKKITITWYSQWFLRARQTRTHLDAVSNFYLNDHGIVYKHELTRVRVNKRTLLSMDELVNLALSAPHALASSRESPLEEPVSLQTCEYVWDCDAPMECCDFVLFKACCANGMRVPRYNPELIPIPIPVPVEPRPPNRP